MDIMIDAPGYPQAVCRKPEWLNGWHIRVLDPLSSSPYVRFTSQLPLIEGENETKLSGVSLMALILGKPKLTKDSIWRIKSLCFFISGIILGVFFLALVLLMVMRYFVSKKRRDNKLEDEDGRRLGSTASGYHSATGSAFPSPPLQHQTERERQGYFLNRPWYWWF